MADNEYLDLMQKAPANVVGASGTSAAVAVQAQATDAPPSVAAVDPGAVKDMETVQNAVAISKTNPKMAAWSAGDPTHVAASIPHYGWMDGLSQAFDRIKSSMFPTSRPSVGVGEEIASEYHGATGVIGKALEPLNNPNESALDFLAHIPALTQAPAAAFGIPFTPIIGGLTATAGQFLEHHLGVNRELTGQILTMLIPLGGKVPKAKIAEAATPHPLVDVAEQGANVMDAVHSAVQGSELQAASKPTMTEFLKQQTDGTPLEHVSISPTVAMEAYQAEGFLVPGGPAPHPNDGILGWVPEINQKLTDAIETGQEIRVPSAEYLTNVDEAGHAALRNGLSFGEGRNIEDAKAIGKTLEAPAEPTEGAPQVRPEIAAAIAKVKAEQYLSPLFKDAKAAGMTEEQFGLYSKKIEAADATLHERLIALEAKQTELQQSSRWLTQAELEHPEARQAIADRPGVDVRHFLATGEDLNGLGISPVKLDRASIAKDFPDLVKDLPKEIFGPNGVGADDLAEAFGFRNGESMLRAIDDAERVRKTSEAVTGRVIPVKEHFNELVKSETDRRVAAKLGNFLSEESIDKAAREATQAPEVQRLLSDELKALAKQAGLPFDKAAVQARAEEIFGRTRSADALNLKALERAVGRTGREAETLLLKGKIPEAFVAKQRQLIANHTLGLAHDYIKEFTRATKQFSRWAKAETVAGVDQTYTNYLHAILGNMSYRLARNGDELVEALGGKTLPEFVEDNIASGLPIPFEGIVGKTPRDLTVSEFRANRDTLTAIAAIGRYVGEIEVAGERIAMQFALTRLEEQRATIGDKFTAEDLKDTSFRGKLASAWRGANSSLKVMEFLYDKLDGGPKGVFNDVIVKPIQGSKHAFDDMAAELTGKFKAFDKAQPKGWDESLDQRIDVPLDYIDPDGQSVRIVKTKKDLIAAALHWGNAENKYKLVEGFGLKDIDFANAFATHMTKPDWDFVQFYWDEAEGLWDQARAMHKRLNDVAPPSVKPESFSTDFGDYRGGHAPVFYDSLLAKNVSATGGEYALFGNRFLRALPSKSYTIKRNGYTAPIELDLDMYKGRFGEMMHDVAYRESLLNADKFLSNQTVRRTMQKMIGPEYTDQTKTWLKNISRAKDYDDRGTAWWNNFVKSARMNMVSVNILYKISTILKHGPTALAKSIDEVGSEPLMAAYKQMTTHPKGWFGALEDAAKESGEVRRRMINNDVQFREAFQNILQKQGWLSKIQEYGAYGVSFSDQFSALPTYIAAKNMALEAGETEANAIALGEKAIRRAHGASSVADIAPILASQNPLWKIVTPFMTFMNNGYNRILETGEAFGSSANAARAGDFKEATQHFSRATMKTFWNVVMPALVEQAVSGEINKKKGFVHKFFDSIAETLSSGIPIARDVVNAATRGTDYAISPIESAVNTIMRTTGDTVKLLEGHRMSPRYIQHMFETVGYFSGLPTGQAGQAVNYLYNFSTGKEHPHSIMQFLHGLRTGKGT